MKTLYNYIIEKANFLVKKHITNTKLSFYNEWCDFLKENFNGFPTYTNDPKIKLKDSKWYDTKVGQYLTRMYDTNETNYIFYDTHKNEWLDWMKEKADDYNWTTNEFMRGISLLDKNGEVICRISGNNEQFTLVTIKKDLVPHEDIV